MQIKLRGTEGYYARAVPLAGHSFRIRELEDEEFAGAIDLMREALQTAQTGTEGLVPEDVTPELLAQAQGARALQVNGEEAARMLRAAREAVDYVVRRGLVGWDLPGNVLCTPETAVLLPPWVKVRLCQAILRETQLQSEEEGNS
jgi:hypothetical protein